MKVASVGLLAQMIGRGIGRRAGASMKVAVLSESASDETAVKIFLEGLLGIETELVIHQLAPNPVGWPKVLQVLTDVFRGLYYFSDAEALAIVVDSDEEVIHKPEHEANKEEKCRVCAINRKLVDVKNSLSPKANRPMIKTAVGLAVPAIEAWLLCGEDARVSEGAWERWLKRREKCGYDKSSLKRAFYGTERASLDLMIAKMEEAATRIVSQENFPDYIEKLFPQGFGYFADGARSWRDS